MPSLQRLNYCTSMVVADVGIKGRMRYLGRFRSGLLFAYTVSDISRTLSRPSRLFDLSAQC